MLAILFYVLRSIKSEFEWPLTIGLYSLSRQMWLVSVTCGSAWASSVSDLVPHVPLAPRERAVLPLVHHVHLVQQVQHVHQAPQVHQGNIARRAMRATCIARVAMNRALLKVNSNGR